MNNRSFFAVVATLLTLVCSAQQTRAQETKLTWLGHAAFKQRKIDSHEMKPGETISFRGRQMIKGK